MKKRTLVLVLASVFLAVSCSRFQYRQNEEPKMPSVQTGMIVLPAQDSGLAIPPGEPSEF